MPGREWLKQVSVVIRVSIGEKQLQPGWTLLRREGKRKEGNAEWRGNKINFQKKSGGPLKSSIFVGVGFKTDSSENHTFRGVHRHFLKIIFVSFHFPSFPYEVESSQAGVVSHRSIP